MPVCPSIVKLNIGKETQLNKKKLPGSFQTLKKKIQEELFSENRTATAYTSASSPLASSVLWVRMLNTNEIVRIECRSVRSSVTVNALRAYVYIYIWQLSSFRVPTLWFADLTVTTCHIQYTCLC